MNRETIDYRETAIEWQSSSRKNTQPSRLLSLINRVWESLTQNLLKRSEPQVWQVRDRAGNTYWKAYDPASGQSLVCSTEREVRIWLEHVLCRPDQPFL